MTITRFIARPQAAVWTRWTGDNLTELETHYGQSFTVDGNGNLSLVNVPPWNENGYLVPEGNWFAIGFAWHMTNADVVATMQDVPSGTLEYDVTAS